MDRHRELRAMHTIVFYPFEQLNIGRNKDIENICFVNSKFIVVPSCNGEKPHLSVALTTALNLRSKAAKSK